MVPATTNPWGGSRAYVFFTTEVDLLSKDNILEGYTIHLSQDSAQNSNLGPHSSAKPRVQL